MQAMASPKDGAPSASGQPDTRLRLAQAGGAGGVEIYVDENGRQIVLDAFTTGVLGVRGTDIQQPPSGQVGTVERRPLPAQDEPAAPDATEPDKLQPHTVSTEPADQKLLDDVAKLLAEVPPAGKDGSHEPEITLPKGAAVAELQVLLDRAGASPGVIDGHPGSNVNKALTAYREITGQDLKATDKAAIDEALAETGGDAFVDYTITPEDAAGPFIASVPADYSSKAKLDRLSFTSVPEMLAERFHMDEAYLKAINPEAAFGRPGTVIKVANTGAAVSRPVDHLIADKAAKQLRAYDSSGRLVAAYPATIGSSDTPSPTGSHEIVRVVTDPGYTYNPNVNFKQGDNDQVLAIPPGPNGPVGSVWIALSKPTYGIHGTPDPSKIGKTASHGCVRLTNWDAAELAKLVKKGVSVTFAD
jgi:lipoprotein-anchoring transpeptidase ErfK/SrfK